MYDAIEDPYTYPGSTVLRNKLDLRDRRQLEAFESEISYARSQEPLPAGRLDFAHFKSIHHHLFQDVYDWAGVPRTVRISKDSSPFCYPENIVAQAEKVFAELKDENFLFGLNAVAFSGKAAHFVAELNAVHAFREGNGRTQTTFLALLMAEAGHHFDEEKLDPVEWLQAMVTSFRGNEGPLALAIRRLMGA
jgi:cell filamentation protein